ncbi:MAG TPA: efflux RND transporter periplasmic adaptor subunit [Thermoanaerobaculia bacterium]|nr:efflux RND transporter periplasmic adaptor subunit [Thermoanaerobaculia bacterium]
MESAFPLEVRFLARWSVRWVRRAVWAVGILLAIGVLRLTVFRPASVAVAVFRAAGGRVEETVINSKAGTVRSRRRATLSSEVGGRVAELPARKGIRVRGGDVLMRIASADYRAQVALQQGALTAAQASRTESCRAAELAERDLARNRELAREQLVSVEILDQLQTRFLGATAACEAARARVGQAEAGLEAARVNLEKTVLRAPFDGVVADVTTEVGEWITPSPPGLPIPPVIVLLDDQSIYVSAPMDEVDVGKVRVGQPVRITMDAYPDRSFPGKVTRVAPYVVDTQEQSRTFEIEAEFDDAAFARRLSPGSSADVEVVRDVREGVLRIPSDALMEGGKVLVLQGGRLASRKVQTGLKNWQFTEILEGLAPGDAVVVSLDRAGVREGARASVEAETTK